MSAKTASPTAQLLRQSRFFSLPRPLPIPSNDMYTHGQMHTRPADATLPLPTQQAIVTTPKSLARGDWGLKRHLPRRVTRRTSNPIVRLSAMDTREHITDFTSATDLTMTLRKLQELDLSVSVSQKSAYAVTHSVFEDFIDNTDPSNDGKNFFRGEIVPDSEIASVGRKIDAKKVTRWKFKGPWVAGMTQGEFEIWIRKELTRRKDEFDIFLQKHARARVLSRRKALHRHEGTLGADANAYEPTSEEIDLYVRSLRKDFSLFSELGGLIEKFLDLPSVPRSDAGVQSLSVATTNRALYEDGPPLTHPSAGASYLRSDAWLDNHPLFGPQRVHAPLEARVLRNLSGPGTRSTSGGVLGVGGIVAPDPVSKDRLRVSAPAAFEDARLELEDRRATGLGLCTQGGNRIWTHPTQLEVSPRGRIRLTVENARETAVGIKTGSLSKDVVDPVGFRGLSNLRSMPPLSQRGTLPRARINPLQGVFGGAATPRPA